MTQAKNGDKVRVHYTGKLEDGSVFDSSSGGDPIEFTIGANQVIPGFEKATIGLAPGETRNFEIPHAEAYGPRRKENVIQVERNQIPEHIHPEKGQHLQIMQQNEQPISVLVTEVSDSHVTLDANHPLAGKDLSFEIELVEIVN